MQFLHKIRRKHLPFVVDEPAYGRWQRIIPKPPILSAPVTYQPMLHATCTMYVSDTIEESYKNATCRWMGTSGWNLNKYILATHSMVKKRENFLACEWIELWIYQIKPHQIDSLVGRYTHNFQRWTITINISFFAKKQMRKRVTEKTTTDQCKTQSFLFVCSSFPWGKSTRKHDIFIYCIYKT